MDLEPGMKGLTYAVRRLLRLPAFTATAVITFAFGIGTTTAIFSLIDQIMVQSLPVAQPEQLWLVGDGTRCCRGNGYRQGSWNFFSWDAYIFLRSNTPEFQNLAAFQGGVAGLAVRRSDSSESARSAYGEYVSGNFFETFGIRPWRGRLLSDADDKQGAPLIAVMSYHTWAQQYASDPSVVGSTYQLNGYPFTVIGIAPKTFFGAKIDGNGTPGFWMPLATEPLIEGVTTRLHKPDIAWLDLIGRVRPDTNPKALEAQLETRLHQWLQNHTADMSALEKCSLQSQTLHLFRGSGGVSPMRKAYRDDLRLMMMGAVCVLLVASANLASLFFARGLRDRNHVAICAALGAARTHLVGRSLIESVALAAIGGAAGLAVCICRDSAYSPSGSPRRGRRHSYDWQAVNCNVHLYNRTFSGYRSRVWYCASMADFESRST